MHIARDTDSFYRGLFRRRWSVWAICALTAAFCAWSASGLVWREDILDLLPDGDEEVRAYREWMSRFRPLDRVYILVGPGEMDGATASENATAVADMLASRLAADPENLFHQITYRVESAQALEAFEVLRKHRAIFFTEEDQRKLEAKLAPAAIRRNLENWKRLLTETPAPFLAREFRADPLGADEALRTKLDAFQSLGGPFHPHEGRLRSRDLDWILILAQPRYPSTDGPRAAALVRFVEEAVAFAEKQAPAGSVRIAWLAGHRYGFENAERIKADLKRTVAISLAGIALLVFLTFSKPAFIFLALLPAAFGGIVATGLVRWLEPGISAIAIGCGSMLIGIAVDYGIHILYHADQQPRERGREGAALLSAILVRLHRPLLLSAATTVFAFLILRFSMLPGYRHLGLFAALGVGGAAAFAVLALPLLIPLLGSRRSRPPFLNAAAWYPPFAEWAARHRRLLLAGILAVSLAALAGLPRLGFEGDYEKLNAASEEIENDRRLIVETFRDAFDVASVIVRGKTLDEALEKAGALEGVLDALRSAELLTGFSSIAPLFPPKSVQEANRARWLDFWTSERRAALRHDLETAAAELRLHPDAFAEFLDHLPGETPLFDPARSGSAIMENLFAAYVSTGSEDTLARMDVRPARREDFETVRERIRARFPEARMVEGRAFMQHMVHLIHRELQRMGLIAFAAVVALLGVVLRDVRRAAVLLLPLLTSALWTFGLLGWLGIRINLMNSMITIFIFGLVIDYSVFLFFARGGKIRDPHFARSAAAVTVSALTTCVGLGSLAMARHPALHTIGLTALFAIGSGWAAVLLTAPLFNGAGRRPSAEKE